MAWITENKQKWRWGVLILIVLAFVGPWGFDRVNVPAEYDCGPNHIRLEGDFCGLPISGIQNLAWTFIGFPNWVLRLITGETGLTPALRQSGFILAVILVLLPIFNISLTLIRGERPRFQKFHLVICGLDFCLLLALGIANHPKFFYALWGIWLYLGVLVCTLVLEGVSSKLSRTQSK